MSNFPSKRTLRRLAAQACVAGLQLTLYNSSHKGVKMMQCPDDAGIYCPEVDCRALVGPDWTPVGLSTSGSADDDDACVTTYCTLAPPRWGEHADATLLIKSGAFCALLKQVRSPRRPCPSHARL